MNPNFVSVIITTFNRYQYLKETLESIHNQTYPFIEIIVVDDGSTEDIAVLNKEICDKTSKCIYFYKPNTGQPSSRNFGIKVSKGSYIAFCDDDDIWLTDKLAIQMDFMKQHSNCSIVTGNIGFINEKSELLDRVKTHIGSNEGYIFKNILIKNRTDSITPLLRKDVFKTVGYFNPEFIIAEDWEFWRRLSYHYEFYTINKVLAYVRIHENNMTKNMNSDPLDSFLLYRKLTKSLLNWGKEKFSSSEYKLIEEVEWLYYKKILINNYHTNFKKIGFLIRILEKDFFEFFYVLNLMAKQEILK